MKYLSLCVMLVGTLVFSGCATTPHAPRTFNQLGQFSTYPLNQNTFRVSFKASPNMNYGTAEEITLLKAAQVTVQKGFRYFTVLQDPSNQLQKPPRQAVIYSAPDFYPPGFYRRFPGFWSDPFYDSPRVVNLDPIEVSYSISCTQTQSGDNKNAFDARLILGSLGQKYGLSPNGEVLVPQLQMAPTGKAPS